LPHLNLFPRDTHWVPDINGRTSLTPEHPRLTLNNPVDTTAYD
jgi:hypothetical protein